MGRPVSHTMTGGRGRGWRREREGSRDGGEKRGVGGAQGGEFELTGGLGLWMGLSIYGRRAAGSRGLDRPIASINMRPNTRDSSGVLNHTVRDVTMRTRVIGDRLLYLLLQRHGTTIREVSSSFYRVVCGQALRHANAVCHAGDRSDYPCGQDAAAVHTTRHLC